MGFRETIDEMRKLSGMDEWRPTGEAEQQEIGLLFKQFELMHVEFVDLFSDVSGAISAIESENGEKKRMIEKLREMKKQFEALRTDARKIRTDAMKLAKSTAKPASAPSQRAA